MMPRVRSRNAYQYVSDFDKGRIVVYTDCGLSYRRIPARIGRDAMTVSKYRIDGFRTVIRNVVLDLNGPLITTSREDRQVARMALIDRTATS
ncbi:HTH_Tnp_Tc3_2 domain-containing protein [Trichonephila clavipes]|nr:HTH_Tnp_Tc3_2 domain-containing protein [Trichonephila clavipes]